MNWKTPSPIQGKILEFAYSLSFVLTLFLTLLAVNVSAQEQLLQKTPRDAEGPFYPVIRQPDEDNNLIQVAGFQQQAAGEILYLSGRVTDEQGRPYPDAIVEIWQTDKNGLYKDRRDRSPGQRDPYFQYWGKAACSGDGSYSFTTLFPGEYQPRPAHIHFKVWINGSVRLTSQIYFKGKKIHTRYATPEIQTVELQEISKGKYKAWFQIVL